MFLKVWFQGKSVGNLFQGTQGNLIFRYEESWAGPALSCSLPLPGSGRIPIEGAPHNFFANLLPEAGARSRICQALGISIDNDFALLAALGRDCAGALQILAPEELPDTAAVYVPLDERTLRKALVSRLPGPRLVPDGQYRMSLAGAQDKWAVYYEGEQLFWPEGGAPSSHILKFAPLEYSDLPQNEAYTTYLADRLGLPVISVLPKKGYSLHPRYDRSGGPLDSSRTRGLTRIHQEDFCQALGLSSFRKYENEGGPTLGDCARLLRENSRQPGKDLLALIRWVVVNHLLGNADAHGKNLSLLYHPRGIRLAPFYDLVCTRVYPGVFRDAAMKIGGEGDPGQLRRRHWEAMAQDLAVQPALVLRILSECLESLEGNGALWYREYLESYDAGSVAERINRLIQKQCRRTRQLLSD